MDKFEKKSVRDYVSKATKTLVDGNSNVEKYIAELEGTMAQINALDQDESKKPSLDAGTSLRVGDIQAALTEQYL